VIENGIEKFPYGRLARWFAKTFQGSMSWIETYIRDNKINGTEFADFSAALRLELRLDSDEVETIRKALKLVKRKSQVVFFNEDGIAGRGWISKVKKGKQTISRLFNKTKPSLIVRRIGTEGLELADCEEEMSIILEHYGLEYDCIKFSKWFDEFRHGTDYILKNNRRRHGKWRPGNHCLIEFENYREAAVALKNLKDSYQLGQCDIDFAREYANLTKVTYPRL